MQVFVLGGSGVQGWQCAKTAASHCGTDDAVIIVSRDRSRGSEAVLRLQKLVKDLEIRSIIADLSKSEDLSAHLRSGDIVLNAAAPFFEFGAIAAQTAIKKGAHYFDICDDWEATLPILALYREALIKDVMAVTGFGAAPGLTSMLAVIAVRELDVVEKIVTAWPLSAGNITDTPSIVPFLHFMQCCVGPIRLMRDCRFVDEEPLQREVVTLPNGGQLMGYTIGSPESVTLPIGHSTVRDSLNLALISDQTADGLRSLARAVRSEEISLRDAANFLLADGEKEQAANESGSSQICAVAIGTKNGQKTSVRTTLAAWPEYGYSIAGVALGLAPSLLAQGHLTGCGAFSIEHSLSPETYLNALAREISSGFEYKVETEIGILA